MTYQLMFSIMFHLNTGRKTLKVKINQPKSMQNLFPTNMSKLEIKEIFSEQL